MLGLLLLLQVGVLASAPEQQTAPAQAATPEPARDAKPEPKVVCTMEPITGVRARKMKVCKTEDYNKRGERDRDTMRSVMGRGGNIQPTLPPGAGG